MMTAKDIVNGYSEMELYRIIRDYGEEKFAKNIAKHIVNARQQKEIETTGEVNSNHKSSHTYESPSSRRTPGQKTSGNSDRTEQRTGSFKGFAGQHDRFFE